MSNRNTQRPAIPMAGLCFFLGAFLAAAPTWAQPRGKTCGVYTNILQFDSRQARDDAIRAQPSFLMDKHKRMIAQGDAAPSVQLVKLCGFNTLFMTIYPLWGKDWWTIPAARNLVKDAIAQSKGVARVHLGLSIFNGGMCDNPA